MRCLVKIIFPIVSNTTLPKVFFLKPPGVDNDGQQPELLTQSLYAGV